MRKERIIKDKKCTIKLIENTERFFTKKENKELVHQIRVIVANSFGVEFENQSLKGIRDHIVSVDICALGYIDNELMGFASVKLLHEMNILYLHGISVLAKVQAKGIGSKLLSNLINHCGNRRIALTTQNPVMYSFLSKFCQNIFPSLERSLKVPKRVHEIGRKLIKGRRGIFDSETFIVKGLYTRCLYGQIPQSKDSLVNKWFNESLEICDGSTLNGVLILGEVKNLN